MNQVFRYPRTWQWIGFLAIFLSVVFPVLMYWNSERIDMRIIAGLIALAVAGVWSYLYVTRYELTLADEGFSVQRLWREPFSLAWREIAIVRSPLGAHEVSFETADRRRIKISVFFPGLPPLLAAARQRLPAASFSRRTA
jgi:hypothetical protein